jgi:hypothetical protein
MRVFSEADLDTVSTVSGDLLVHSEHSVLEDDYADDLIQSEHPTREETLMAVEEPDLGQSLQLWGESLLFLYSCYSSTMVNTHTW